MPTFQLDIRLVVRVAAALALCASTACSSTECEEFYDTYEHCDFGEAGDVTIDDCNERADANADCETAYHDLNACIDDLEDVCDYPTACRAELELAPLTCATF